MGKQKEKNRGKVQWRNTENSSKDKYIIYVLVHTETLTTYEWPLLTGQSSVQGYKEGTGTSFIWGKSERAGAVQSDEEKAQGHLISGLKYLMGGGEEEGTKIFSVMHTDRTRSNGHTWNSIWTKENPFLVTKVEQVVQRGCGVWICPKR